MIVGRETPSVAAGKGDRWQVVGRMANHWFRPLVEPPGWVALASLLLGVVAAPLLFSAILVALAVGFGLLVVGVGVPLTVWAFVLVDRLARLQRDRARWLGETIAERPPRPHRGVGGRAFVTVVSDPTRWRQVAFFTADVVVAPVLFVVAVLPMGIGVGLWIPGFPNGLGGVGGTLLRLAVLSQLPRWAMAIARLKTAFDRWFLGADPLATMAARVSTLTTQRQDVLDAVAVERRRIERNLHDGVQQQLVAMGIDLGLALHHLDDRPEEARALLLQARGRLQGSIGELRQLGRGLHPAVLGDRGLDAALSAVVANSPIPITVHVDPALGLPVDAAETVYFVANEAVANIFKHARARAASIRVTDLGRGVRIAVHDDGVGGADPSVGTGLAGLRARVVAMDGTFALTSPAGGPTTLVVEVPFRG